MRKYYTPQNRNACIRSRFTRNGKLRTETHRRDSGTMSVAVSTEPRNNATQLYIDFADGDTLALDGHSARTLFRVLEQHFATRDRIL